MELSGAMGLLVLAFLVIAVAMDCKRGLTRIVSARNVFLLSLIAWYAAEATLAPSAIAGYSAMEQLSALVCVLLCAAMFLGGYYVKAIGVTLANLTTKHRPTTPTTASHHERSRFAGLRVFGRHFLKDKSKLFRETLSDPKTLWFVFVLLLVIGFLPLLIVADGNPITIFEDAFTPRKRWSSLFQRGRYGDGRDALLEMQMCLLAAVPLAASIVLLSKQPIAKRIAAGALLTYMMSRALNDGSRMKVVEVGLPIAAAIYWKFSEPLRKWVLAIGLPLIAVFAVFWAAVTVVGRDEGKRDWRKGLTANYLGFEMYRELLYLRKAVPDVVPYQMGHTYYVQLVNPIPRFLWKAKPRTDAGLELARMHGDVLNGEPKLTIAPGLIGEMYWNFGIPGILGLSLLFGCVARFWDHFGAVCEESTAVFPVFAAGLAVIFICGRSLNASSFYGLLSLLIVTNCVGHAIKACRGKLKIEQR